MIDGSVYHPTQWTVSNVPGFYHTPRWTLPLVMSLKHRKRQISPPLKHLQHTNEGTERETPDILHRATKNQDLSKRYLTPVSLLPRPRPCAGGPDVQADLPPVGHGGGDRLPGAGGPPPALRQLDQRREQHQRGQCMFEEKHVCTDGEISGVVTKQTSCPRLARCSSPAGW